ncbi:Ger(x)C family spore germination protein [Paenibacillaceae bacterium WGS1546]|uniref:Ger(x)C family spore germination protein n=1 Tax=Cohnella sp. WGS1546 TaxID=3366810 RepID=UPI00372D6D7E
MRFILAPGMIVVLLAAALLSGCWSRYELNELAIVVGLGIDKAGPKYRVTVQIVNPGAVSANQRPGGQAPVVTFEEEGSTLPDALRRMTVQSPRKLYFSHLRMIVLGEAAARAGLRKPLDYLSREPEMRNDFYLVTAKGTTASQILKIYSAVDPIPANNLYTKLALSDRLWAATGKITLNELVVDMATKGKSAMMTGVRIQGNLQKGKRTNNARQITPAANLVYAGSAVFKDDKLIGWIGEDETKAVNYVDNTVVKSLGFVDCPGGGKVSFNIVNSKSVIRVGMERGIPAIDVHLRIEQDIADVECDIDLSLTSSLDQLNRLSERKVADLIDNTVEHAQTKLGADIFGFGTEVHRQRPKEWSEIKDWNEMFRKIRIRTHIFIVTRRIGTIQQSIEHQTRGRG